MLMRHTHPIGQCGKTLAIVDDHREARFSELLAVGADEQR
jgi:hypothetical protein